MFILRFVMTASSTSVATRQEWGSESVQAAN